MSSGQDVADLVGCTGFTGDSEELYVTEGGGCILDGEDISVYYFADDGAQSSYLDAATGFGGVYLIGNKYLVEAKPGTLEQLQSDLGGDLSE